VNWFERYGIPGFYFIFLPAIFYWIIFGFPSTQQNGLAALALGVAFSASIPLGYILVIFGQLIYYKISPWRVHREAWKKAGIGGEKEEWLVEANATILARLECSGKIERGRWLQEWFMKRFDVLAINSALMLATLIGWVLYPLGLFFKPEQRVVNTTHIVDFGLISLFIFLILCFSTHLLTKQAKYIATAYYKALKNESEEMSTDTT